MMSRARDRMQLTQGLRVFHYRRVDEITSGIVRAAHRSMYIPLVITVLAAALRLFRLDARSFWLDEIFTARITHLRSFADLQATLRTEPDQMPMYYLLTWLLRGMGGSEVVVRMPSVIAGTLSVVVIYLLGRQLFRHRVGWVAGLLMACLPFAVWYGQEARGYALLILFSALQILAAFHVVTRGCARYWALLAVATVFALYTHYVALAATATIAFYITLSGVVSLRGYSLMRQFLYALLTWLVVVVAYAPWLANLQSFLGNAGLGFGRARGASGLNWSQLQVWLASLDLHSILLALFLIGSASAAFKLFAGPWRAGSRLVLFCMAVPVAAFAVRSHGDVTAITPRYFAFVYPEVVLAISLGIEFSLCQLALRLRIRKSIAFVAVLTLVLLQITPSLAASYAHPKDDYRGVARFIAGANPAHSVVLGLGGGADFAALGLSYYFRRDGAPVTVLSGANVDARTAQQLATPGGQVWGIVFVADGRPYFTHPLPRGFSTLNFTGLTLTCHISRLLLQRRSSCIGVPNSIPKCRPARICCTCWGAIPAWDPTFCRPFSAQPPSHTMVAGGSRLGHVSQRMAGVLS